MALAKLKSRGNKFSKKLTRARIGARGQNAAPVVES
jgi:hypothetical protein